MNVQRVLLVNGDFPRIAFKSEEFMPIMMLDIFNADIRTIGTYFFAPLNKVNRLQFELVRG